MLLIRVVFLPSIGCNLAYVARISGLASGRDGCSNDEGQDDESEDESEDESDEEEEDEDEEVEDAPSPPAAPPLPHAPLPKAAGAALAGEAEWRRVDAAVVAQAQAVRALKAQLKAQATESVPEAGGQGGGQEGDRGSGTRAAGSAGSGVDLLEEAVAELLRLKALRRRLAPPAAGTHAYGHAPTTGLASAPDMNGRGREAEPAGPRREGSGPEEGVRVRVGLEEVEAGSVLGLLPGGNIGVALWTERMYRKDPLVIQATARALCLLMQISAR